MRCESRSNCYWEGLREGKGEMEALIFQYHRRPAHNIHVLLLRRSHLIVDLHDGLKALY